MVTIPPFAPRVRECTLSGTRTFASLAQYKQQRTTWRTGPKPGIGCRYCQAVFRTVEAAQETECHAQMRYVPDYTVTRRKSESLAAFLLNRRATRRIEVVYHTPAMLVDVARVETELGDDLALYATPERACRTDYRPSEAEWLSSSISPDNRGQLPAARNDVSWTYSRSPYLPAYVHTHGYIYRRPARMAERRQLAASAVDERVPVRRAKRADTALGKQVEMWDERPVVMQRSWKVKKVRKQWMVNLG